MELLHCTKWDCVCRELKTVIKLTERQSAFYYHHVLIILNHVTDKIPLPKDQVEPYLSLSNIFTNQHILIPYTLINIMVYKEVNSEPSQLHTQPPPHTKPDPATYISLRVSP